MRRILLLLLLLSGICLRTVAQGLEVIGSQIAMPEGHIIGATFYEEKGIFLIQQGVPSLENNNPTTRWHRQLSSWGLKSQLMVTKRVFDMFPRGTSGCPSGRVDVSTKSHQILICIDAAYLDILDPESLSTVGRIAYRNDQRIYDFAVDDLRSRVLVLSSRNDGSLRLTVYSMLDGAQQQEAILEYTHPLSFWMELALESKTGLVGVAVQGLRRSNKSTDIFFCGSGTVFGCSNAEQVSQVGQIDFLGRELLLTSNNISESRNKKDCIRSIDPTTHSISHEYCSPATGVHYAVGVVCNRYVVGYTGISKFMLLSEEIKYISNSFSVWRAGNRQVSAVTKNSTDVDLLLNAMRVVGSRTEPFFLVYNMAPNMLFLYSIVDTN